MLDDEEVNEKLCIEVLVEGDFENRDAASKHATNFMIDLDILLSNGEYENLAITFSNATIGKADREKDADN